uniref:hypothetical protein n=1 Tax=Oceanobacillus halotolerans TaxID=2663380 RepID=UPI001CF7CB23|nr:hypothetical protein [Oceanobacillus halotolerans]
MDTWFNQQPLIKNIKEQGIDVIGMVENLKQRNLVGNEHVSLKELYYLTKPVSGKKGVLRSNQTTQANGVPIKVVFVRNRNKKSDWLAILSTDCTCIYGMR